MKTTFINKIKEGAISAYVQYQILPSLTLAQAIVESGWGMASIGNNIFGIKASGGWKGRTKTVETREFVNGNWITINAAFRDYDSVADSIKDRSTFLTKSRYKKVLKAANYQEACREIYLAGYATDPNYTNLLITIIEQNKLYEFDELAREVVRKQSEVSIVKNSNVSEWAKKSWEWAISVGLIDGTRPKDSITREEVAIILKRMVELK